MTFEKNIAELTLRSILLAILLTVLLAISNAYLALRLGILTSASIPAAILSMGILRFFKNPSILENNAVQTAASAGEAVAGGIVYTIPALIIIEYWHQFDYFTNFFIALAGGVLGVLFSIPLRRILVNEPILQFPEGRAIAEVLKTSRDDATFKHLLWGGGVGALIELCQVGFKLIATQWSYWVVFRQTLFGMNIGFSATMIGAGFLVGQDMALSIFLGAGLAWGIGLPVISRYHADIIQHNSAVDAMMKLWETDLRYLGIGAMLFAGVWTLIKLSKPLYQRIASSLVSIKHDGLPVAHLRTDQDIPMPLVFSGILVIGFALFWFFQSVFPLKMIGFTDFYAINMIFIAIAYVLMIGFLFSVITAYFSGMVGVSASPGSSVVIAGILFSAWLFLAVIHAWVVTPLSHDQLKAVEAMTIIVGSIVTGIAAIANDNTQDLKVGQLVGATPWKQQLMLLLGVVVSALVIPPVMHLLFDVYGIAGVMPRPGMDASQSLPAPTAVLLAAITTAVFQHALPWQMLLIGASMMILLMMLDRVLHLKRLFNLSVLGVAIGMYLPLSSSFPLFIGGMIAHRVKRTVKGHTNKQQIGTLIACGLVAGSALIDVLLALIFSLTHSQNALALMSSARFEPYRVLLAVITIFILSVWIKNRVSREQ